PATLHDKLAGCPNFTSNKHPTRMIVLTLPAPLNLTDLKPDIKQYEVTDSPWTEPNTSKPLDPPTPPDWSPKTELDLDLAPGNETGAIVTTPDMVLVRIIVADTSVKIRDDGYAIAAGNDNGKNGQNLCSFTGGFGTTQATFLAYYRHGVAPTYGRYNVG